MIHFYTHFDSNYRPFGLALLESLKQHVPDVCLHVMALDEFDIPGAVVHPVDDVLASLDLSKQQIQADRSYRDFAWTLEPIWCWFITRQSHEQGFYVDADSFFFNGIESVLAEIEPHHLVGLTPHNFPNPEREKQCGRYNFGFGWFRCNDETQGFIEEWAIQTIENRGEGYGGQRLLDQWPSILGDSLLDFKSNCNVGPWQLPDVTGEPPMLRGKPLINMHLHEFRRGTGRNPVEINGVGFNRTNYELSPNTIESVYKPYEAILAKYV